MTRSAVRLCQQKNIYRGPRQNKDYFAVVLVDRLPLRRIIEVQQQMQVAAIIQLCINKRKVGPINRQINQATLQSL